MDQSTALLERIAKSQELTVTLLQRLLMSLTKAAAPKAGAIASDEDLDGPYGDPEIRKDPPRWTGESFVGHRYSYCPPEYLRVMAEFLDWLGNKAEEEGQTTASGKSVAVFKRIDAARARGWAARAVNRIVPKNEDIPF